MDTEEWICRRNIEMFRRQLESAVSQERRATLVKLLVEHQERLRQLIANPSNENKSDGD